MKFTKFTSLLLASGTLLSGFAMVAPTVANAATNDQDPAISAEVNGGQALPQNGKTTAGISFGQPTSTGNTGYLRLQMVPKILDFGNHEIFDTAFPNFNAAGVNISNTGNDRFPNYKSGDTNQTAILNTTDKDLAAVEGKAWATVVDKQSTRTAEENAKDPSKLTDSVAGSWTLSVKADGPLNLLNDQGTATGKTIDGAILSMKNTASAETTAVYGLTNETQDQDYVAGTTVTPVSDVSKVVTMNLAAGSTDQKVATAAAGEGEGADVFAWNKGDIMLNIPSTNAVENGIYETTLTWTLSTGIGA